MLDLYKYLKIKDFNIKKIEYSIIYLRKFITLIYSTMKIILFNIYLQKKFYN